MTSNLGRERAVCANDTSPARHTGWVNRTYVWLCCDCFALQHPHPDDMHDGDPLLPSTYSDEALSYLRQEADDAEARLRGAVEFSCPGPHTAKQHRDKRPPWCNVCGKSDRGILLRDSTGTVTRG